MDILDWILRNCPGRVETLADRIEVFHDNGDHSTLWCCNDEAGIQQLRALGSVYSRFDGADLFSSTFKFASSSVPRVKGGVTMTFTLGQLIREVESIGCKFPRTSVPFMYQAGIGYYAVDSRSGRIYEFDSETGDYDEYESLEQLLDDWLSAIR
ncbi:hypothetical protein DTL21_05715 [Bremerella cremea]|uniref:SMI1/KNR4 family protein n=1 Tax=Blastopirellula marina TaxID=124 RepID=A0A2S8FZE2_9BACT|nr:hypothetical protein C5Y83_05715 [Blastopirellula marina]RCS49827.1 hypothetical protein DTL21_05715 [Bremerella cremea]